MNSIEKKLFMIIKITYFQRRIRHFSILFILLMISCNSTGIENQKRSIIKFQNLPSEVKKEMFLDDKIKHEGNIKLKLFSELNEIPKYDYVSNQSSSMPWVKEGEIIRKSDGKRFELNFSSEHRAKYVVLEDYLYVPRHYNIYMKDSLKYSFSRFKLD